MPRFLSIDWDPPKLNALAVNAGRSSATAEQPLTLALDAELTPATADAIGKKLRDALKTANIVPAPVLFCVGRERVIIKELAVPYAPAHEEPSLVRFQAAKELTDPASEVVLDYAHLSVPKANQPTRVLVVSLRKSHVQALTTVCQSAGLKLAGIAPRFYAALGLSRGHGAATTPICQGFLLGTGQGAELTVFSGDRILFARALPGGPGLAAEAQRNLLLLASQNPEAGAVQKITVANVPDLGTMTIPVEKFDAGTVPSTSLAALGLAELWGRSGVPPVNLAAPKEPRVVTGDNERRIRLAIIAAACLLPVLIAFYYINLSKVRAETRRMQNEKLVLEMEWKKLEQERLDVQGLKDWENTTVSWIDEFHDLAARMPFEKGFRITQIAAAPLTRASGASVAGADKKVARMTIHGVMNAQQDKFVTALTTAVSKDPHLSLASPEFKTNEFILKIDVAAQSGKKYATNLVVPPNPSFIRKNGKAPPEELEQQPFVEDDQ